MSINIKFKTQKDQPPWGPSPDPTQKQRVEPKKKTAIHEVKIYGADSKLKRTVPAVSHENNGEILKRSGYAKRKTHMKGRMK